MENEIIELKNRKIIPISGSRYVSIPRGFAPDCFSVQVVLRDDGTLLMEGLKQ